jgi:hypothetical protein
MSQARGIATQIQVWDESTYGVTPVTPAGEILPFRTCNVKGAIARAMDETIRGVRGLPPGIQTNRDVSGQIVQTLAPQSCIKMLKYLIGAPTITTIGTATQFVFSLAGAFPVGFGMQKDYGSAIATPGRYEVLKGCRLSKGSFKFGASGFVDCTYDVRGATFDTSASASADSSPDSFGHSGFSMAVGSLKEGGSTIATVTDLTIDWDNDLDDSLFVIGGGGVRGSLPEGFARISGSLTALFTDASLLNKGRDNTESSLEMLLSNGSGDGTAGNESIKFLLPNLAYDYTSPEIAGPKGIKVTLAFNAQTSGTSEQAASVTVKAMRTTA